MLVETSLPESHLDNSAVPNCSEDYVEGNECSLSSSGCSSSDNDCAGFSGNYTEFVSQSSSHLRGNPEEAEEGVIEDDTLEHKVLDAIVCAIFEALDLLHETKGSLKNFEELLTMARHMVL